MDERAVVALERIGDELAGIRTLLEILAMPGEAPAPVCEHPMEFRKDFGITGGRPDWHCGVPGCGYQSLKDAA